MAMHICQGPKIKIDLYIYVREKTDRLFLYCYLFKRNKNWCISNIIQCDGFSKHSKLKINLPDYQA